MTNSLLVEQHQTTIQSRYQGSIHSFNHSYNRTAESAISRCWLGEKGLVDGPQCLCSHLCKVRCMICVASVVPQITVSLVNKRQFLWIGENESQGPWDPQAGGVLASRGWIQPCIYMKTQKLLHRHLWEYTARHLQAHSVSKLDCCLELLSELRYVTSLIFKTELYLYSSGACVL